MMTHNLNDVIIEKKINICFFKLNDVQVLSICVVFEIFLNIRLIKSHLFTIIPVKVVA